LVNKLGFNPKIKLQKSSRRLPVWAKSQTKIQNYFLPFKVEILEAKILAIFDPSFPP